MRAILGLAAAAIVLCLLGCATAARQVQSFDAVSFDYVQRLRWEDWPGVGQYAPDEEREAFIQRMLAEKDLHITDVRQEGIETAEEGRATVRLAVEYYRLPSPTVKTLRLRQEWALVEGSRDRPGGWRLLAPLPPLP